MPSYTSTHTGKQIDDAVDAVNAGYLETATTSNTAADTSLSVTSSGGTEKKIKVSVSEHTLSIETS